jgi:phosphoglucosamine mutase
LGKARRINDATGRYVEFCKGTLPSNFNLAGYKIVIDCAHGATYNAAPKVFQELGAETITMGNKPDGFNINQDCGSTHMEGLCKRVLEEQADFGIAFDGDGDRVMFVDSSGHIVDGDELIYIIAQHQHQSSQGCAGVAGTLMSNLGLEQALNGLNIPFHRTAVGDRYVVEALKERGWSLGGENSGHVLCSDLNTTGDGIVAALQVIRALSDSGKTLTELKSQMTKFPQILVNVRLPKKVDISKNATINAAVVDAERVLDGTGRVLLRPSGTEPLIRVMAEGENQALVQQQVDTIARVVEEQVGV